MGTVCITRRTQTGRFYLGNYLLDVWFLGVKDAFVREIDPLQISHLIESQPMEEKSPAYAKALIMASIEYGRENGVEPRLDGKNRKFIEHIPYDPQAYQFEFGKDGSPLYIDKLDDMLELELMDHE